jgi:hypothetical protein
MATMKPLAGLSDDELGALIRRQHQLLPDAPLAVQQSLIALWHSSPLAGGQAARAPKVLRQIAALLSFDSWSVPMLEHGVRSPPSPTRHLLYSAAGRDVDLRISALAESYSLYGQVLGPDESGSVELSAPQSATESTQRVHVAELNALGEFHIDGLHQGRYRLTLRMGGDQIELPQFDVGKPDN